MSSASTGRFTLAATATAALAFLLVVPTVLHLADPAFGQTNCVLNGYEAACDVQRGESANVSVQVGNVSAGATVSFTLGAGADLPLQPASVDQARAIADQILGGSLQLTVEHDDELTDLFSVPSVATELLADEGVAAKILDDKALLAQLVLVPGALDALLTAETTSAAVLDQILEDEALLTSVLTDGGALRAVLATEKAEEIVDLLLADKAALVTVATDGQALGAVLSTNNADTVVSALLDQPEIRDALLADADATAALLQNDKALVAVQTDAKLLETVLTTLIQSPKVTGVEITSGVAASNVVLNVKEYLPTDTDQTAINVGEGASLASISISVAVPATETTEAMQQSFAVLKVLEIHADGIAKGGVSSAKIGFQLTDAELRALGIAPGDVQMLHQVDGKFVPLETAYLGLSGGVHQFSVLTPSFSYFVIAAKQAPEEVGEAGMSALAFTAIALAVAVLVAVAVALVLKRRQA